MISMKFRALKVFNSAQCSLFRGLITLHLLLVPLLPSLLFILLLGLLLELWLCSRYHKILYFADLGNKLVKAITYFLGRMIGLCLLGIVLTLTLRTFVGITLSPCWDYELFFLMQFSRSLIRWLSIQNLSITINHVPFHFWEGFTDMAWNFSLIDTKH